jgi:hypothetical protein
MVLIALRERVPQVVVMQDFWLHLDNSEAGGTCISSYCSMATPCKFPLPCLLPRIITHAKHWVPVLFAKPDAWVLGLPPPHARTQNVLKRKLHAKTFYFDVKIILSCNGFERRWMTGLTPAMAQSLLVCNTTYGHILCCLNPIIILVVTQDSTFSVYHILLMLH